MRDTLPGTAAIGKAVSVLDHLAAAGPSTLADLVAALEMPRATTYRLAEALLGYGLAAKDRGGHYRLGPRLAELGRLAGLHRPSLARAATPPLERLRDRTGESTQLFVAEGGRRVCIVSLESPHSLRTIVAVGAALPMDRGSAGRVLSSLAAGRARAGNPAWVESVEERELGVASVSAPVYLDGEVVAAVSVSGPVERTSRSPGARYGDMVAEAARDVAAALA
ncbi:MAG TPA: IclR family transcriptional regulator C-terminal domain-containing protein [Acidimicrobiales bacterium]|nr:IclR family transcriptional regulator C-terminal domain-containing protein [Acidimicrobiales bacterium]